METFPSSLAPAPPTPLTLLSAGDRLIGLLQDKCLSLVHPETRLAGPVSQPPSSSACPSSELPACTMLDPHSSTGSRRRRKRKPKSAPVSAAKPSAPATAEPAAPACHETAPTINFDLFVSPLVSSPVTVLPPCLPLPPPPICLHMSSPPQAPSSCTPLRPFVPLPPPWLQPPSSPPWPISPPASPVSILPPVKHLSFISLPSPLDFTPPYSLPPSVPQFCWFLHSLLLSVVLPPLRPSGALSTPWSAELPVSPWSNGPSALPGLHGFSVAQDS
ncbi:uncharacterized protein [Chanodichthys erythropterus]|uniref:uncharacterized protein n=1 Tax=Chanodichthys erythropterus TaxID=933992 RepID=UPI00351F07C9